MSTSELIDAMERSEKFNSMVGKLEPCPFCGGDNLSMGILHQNSSGTDIYIQCDNCAAKIQLGENTGEEELFRRWNMRLAKEM